MLPGPSGCRACKRRTLVWCQEHSNCDSRPGKREQDRSHPLSGLCGVQHIARRTMNGWRRHVCMFFSLSFGELSLPCCLLSLSSGQVSDMASTSCRGPGGNPQCKVCGLGHLHHPSLASLSSRRPLAPCTSTAVRNGRLHAILFVPSKWSPPPKSRPTAGQSLVRTNRFRLSTAKFGSCLSDPTFQTANPAANVSNFPEHAGKTAPHAARSNSSCSACGIVKSRHFRAARGLAQLASQAL